MIGAEKPLGEALRPGAKFRLIRTRDRGVVQQILLIEPPELRHCDDDTCRIPGLPRSLEYLIRLLQQRALASERAGLPEVDQSVFGLRCPLLYIGDAGDREGEFLQRAGRCGEPRHERRVEILQHGLLGDQRIEGPAVGLLALSLQLACAILGALGVVQLLGQRLQRRGLLRDAA
jgi:hypothetical protein